MAMTDNLPDPRLWNLPAGYILPLCPFDLNGAHDFDAHVVDGFVRSQSCRKCGLILPIEDPTETGGPTAFCCHHCGGELFAWGGPAFISKTSPGQES